MIQSGPRQTEGSWFDSQNAQNRETVSTTISLGEMVNIHEAIPETARETRHEACPASLEAVQVYMPLSEQDESWTQSTARLFWKLTWYLSEPKSSLLSLYQVTVSGWEPDTRASIFTVLPTVSTMDSEGFLVKFGGTLRSVCGGESERNEVLLWHWEMLWAIIHQAAGPLQQRATTQNTCNNTEATVSSLIANT